jgi:hypothetical protein
MAVSEGFPNTGIRQSRCNCSQTRLQGQTGRCLFDYQVWASLQ